MTATPDQTLSDAVLLANRGRPVSAFDLASAVLEDALARSDQPARAEASAQLAWFCLMLSRPEEGLAFARLAAGLARSLGLAAVEAHSRSTAAWLTVEIGEPNPVEEAGAALAAAERAGSPAAVAFAHNALGICFYALQQPDLAVRECTVAAESARALNDPVAEGRYLNNAAISLANLADSPADPAQRTDRYREAAALAGRGLVLCEAAGDSWGARVNLCNLAEFTMILGQPAEARALLAHHARLDGELGARDRAHYAYTLSICLVADELWAEAETALKRCIACCPHAQNLELQLLAERDLAALLARQRRFDEAYEAHRRFHALYVSRSADGAQRRGRAIAIQHDMERLAAGFEAERVRADALAATNHALAAETARLLRDTLEDPLTGLPNRRALDEILARSGAEPVVLAMIDIDDFKRINDERSHAVGDLVLRELGHLLSETLPPPAFVARYGGEEFTALLPHPDAAQAIRSCEALRHAVEAYPWASLQNGLRVTVSIGVAIAWHGSSTAELLRLADERLYLAKRRGRNRVETGLSPHPNDRRSALRLAASGS